MSYLACPQVPRTSIDEDNIQVIISLLIMVSQIETVQRLSGKVSLLCFHQTCGLLNSYNNSHDKFIGVCLIRIEIGSTLAGVTTLGYILQRVLTVSTFASCIPALPVINIYQRLYSMPRSSTRTKTYIDF